MSRKTLNKFYTGREYLEISNERFLEKKFDKEDTKYKEYINCIFINCVFPICDYMGVINCVFINCSFKKFNTKAPVHNLFTTSGSLFLECEIKNNNYGEGGLTGGTWHHENSILCYPCGNEFVGCKEEAKIVNGVNRAVSHWYKFKEHPFFDKVIKKTRAKFSRHSHELFEDLKSERNPVPLMIAEEWISA